MPFSAPVDKHQRAPDPAHNSSSFRTLAGSAWPSDETIAPAEESHGPHCLLFPLQPDADPVLLVDRGVVDSSQELRSNLALCLKIALKRFLTDKLYLEKPRS